MGLLLATVVGLGSAAGDSGPPAPSPERVAIEGLITAAPLPAGYQVTRQEISERDRVLRHKLFVTREGVLSSAVVTVEPGQFVVREQKIAAFEGCVNVTALALSRSGLRFLKSNVPQVRWTDFRKRVTAEFLCTRPQGGDLIIQLQFFFARSGYNILVIADNQKDYDALVRWASSVQGE